MSGEDNKKKLEWVGIFNDAADKYMKENFPWAKSYRWYLEFDGNVPLTHSLEEEFMNEILLPVKGDNSFMFTVFTSAYFHMKFKKAYNGELPEDVRKEENRDPNKDVQPLASRIEYYREVDEKDGKKRFRKSYDGIVISSLLVGDEKLRKFVQDSIGEVAERFGSNDEEKEKIIKDGKKNLNPYFSDRPFGVAGFRKKDAREVVLLDPSKLRGWVKGRYARKEITKFKPYKDDEKYRELKEKFPEVLSGLFVPLGNGEADMVIYRRLDKVKRAEGDHGRDLFEGYKIIVYRVRDYEFAIYFERYTSESFENALFDKMESVIKEVK